MHIKYVCLTLCMLGDFSYFLSSADFFLFKVFFYRNTLRGSIGLDTDQDRRSVGLDLSPNCLQRLSAASKERAKIYAIILFN